LSAINVQVVPTAAAPEAGVVTMSASNGDADPAQFLAVPRDHRFLTVDNMLQAVSIETLESDEDDQRLL